MEGLMKRGSCKAAASAANEPYQATFRPSGSLLVDDGLVCSLDYIDEPVSRGCYCLRIANWSEVFPPKFGKKKNRGETERASYLILEKLEVESAENSDTNSIAAFRRIGMGFDIVAKVDKLLANTERWQLRLV
jgi:hypothetical protein